MPCSHYRCQKEVKQQLSFNHRKCCYDRKCSYIRGGVLNCYLKKPVFSSEEEFRVCRTLANKLKYTIVPRNPIKLTRRTKSVRVVVHGCDDEIIDLTRKRNKKEKLEDNMKKSMKKYRKSYGELTMRERQRRIDDFAIEIMAGCFAKKEFESEESIRDCVVNNIDMAADVKNFMSALQQKVQQYLGTKVDMMVQKDTETSNNGSEGLVAMIDENTK